MFSDSTERVDRDNTVKEKDRSTRKRKERSRSPLDEHRADAEQDRERWKVSDQIETDRTKSTEYPTRKRRKRDGPSFQGGEDTPHHAGTPGSDADSMMIDDASPARSRDRTPRPEDLQKASSSSAEGTSTNVTHLDLGQRQHQTDGGVSQRDMVSEVLRMFDPKLTTLADLRNRPFDQKFEAKLERQKQTFYLDNFDISKLEPIVKETKKPLTGNFIRNATTVYNYRQNKNSGEIPKTPEISEKEALMAIKDLESQTKALNRTSLVGEFKRVHTSYRKSAWGL